MTHAALIAADIATIPANVPRQTTKYAPTEKGFRTPKEGEKRAGSVVICSIFDHARSAETVHLFTRECSREIWL